jgi:multiple sugar transport system permease protein/raffinose/stachyose/melibiose transport system permease protein
MERIDVAGSAPHGIESAERAQSVERWLGRGVARTRELRAWAPLAVPALFFIGAFFLVPLLANLTLAFTNWSGFKNGIQFVGLDNFADLATLDLLSRPIFLTLVYAVVAMVGLNCGGLALALALEDKNRINVFLRSLFFTPVLLSSIAVGFLWRGYLEPDGPANALLGTITGTEVHVAWLAQPTFTIVVLALIDAWKWLGFSTLIYVAGLNAIPRELKDAARVDGAGQGRLFWNVKRPLLAPAFTFNFVIGLIGSLNAFDTIMATTRGGPGTSSTVLNIVIWKQFTGGMYGFASSATLTVALLIVAIAVPVVLILRRRELQA